MSQKTKVILTILCLGIAFMDISGLPGVLLKVNLADIDPYIIPLMINFILIGILAIVVLKLFKVTYDFGFSVSGLREGLKRYAIPGIVAGVLSFAAFFIGLFPFDYRPTIWKILIEGVLYYIGVGIVEEFYVRGLFLNIVCTCQQILDTKYQKIVSYIVRLYKPYATLDIAPRNAVQVMPTV